MNKEIISDDFLLIPKSTDIRCFSCSKRNTESEEPFYLTEWELSTGASTDGIHYCQSCIINRGEPSMTILVDSKNRKSTRENKITPTTVFTLTFTTLDLNYSNISISEKIHNVRLDLNKAAVEDKFGDIIRAYNDPSISTIQGMFNGKYVNIEKKYISGYFVDVLHRVEGESCQNPEDDSPPWNP